MTAMLPTEFAELEAFSEWCLPTEAERYAKRLASSMAEMQAFYDAITAARRGSDLLLRQVPARRTA